MQALNSKLCLLVYPTLPNLGSLSEVGLSAEFERIEIGGCTVVGMIVESRGISKRNGFKIFAERLGAAIRSYGI